MVLLLLNGEVGVLGEAHTDQFHEVAQGAPSGEVGDEGLQEDVFVKPHQGLLV